MGVKKPGVCFNNGKTCPLKILTINKQLQCHFKARKQKFGATQNTQSTHWSKPLAGSSDAAVECNKGSVVCDWKVKVL